MEPRRLAAGQLGPLCIHALNRRSGRRPFPRPPFSRESDRLEVRGWRDGGPGGADGPRARPLRGPPPGPPPRGEARLRGALGPRAGAGPAASVLPRRPREERVSTCPQIASLLITRVIRPTSPTAQHLAPLPALVRVPRSGLGPCLEHEQSSPTRMLWWSRGGAGKKKKKELGSSIFQKNAQWIMLDHMTLPMPHHF